MRGKSDMNNCKSSQGCSSFVIVRACEALFCFKSVCRIYSQLKLTMPKGKKKVGNNSQLSGWSTGTQSCQPCIGTKVLSQTLNMSIYSLFYMCGALSGSAAAAKAPWEGKLWLTALRSPPLSPPPLLERDEVKCAPSNKHTRMPMQNTLPSLLATAIFLKLMSSGAAEVFLSGLNF